MEFDWDAPKAALNLRKHGIAFDEAMEVFEPQKPVILEDTYHSDAEDRYYAIGVSAKGRLLTVCFSYRGAMIRIISARKATNREVEAYGDEIRKSL